MTSLRLHEHNRATLRVRAAETLVVLPVGATEQHGPHLPVGTDWLVIEHLALEAAAMAGAEISVLVAPVLPFGSSSHHLPFGGTISISSETYYRLLVDMLTSLISGGFRRLFVLNGHGGNHELVQLAARDVALQHPVSVGAASYWTVAWDALIAAGAHAASGRMPGHAGAFETAVVLALNAALVTPDRPHRDQYDRSDPRSFAPPYRAEHNGSWQRIDGYSDSPDLGTAEDGRRYLAAIVPALAQAFIGFYRAAAAAGH